MELRLYNHLAGLFFVNSNCLTSVSSRAKYFRSAQELYTAKKNRTFPDEWLCVYRGADDEWHVAGKPNEKLINF